MRTKVKNEKGITLVALIITIIVLVILATVSISVITNSGMINAAIKGAQDYSEAQKDEESKLQEIQETLENAIGGNAPTPTQVANITPTPTLSPTPTPIPHITEAPEQWIAIEDADDLKAIGTDANLYINE